MITSMTTPNIMVVEGCGSTETGVSGTESLAGEGAAAGSGATFYMDDKVAVFDDDLQRLAARMTELMHDAQGVGLAATQVGVLRRLFVFEPGEGGPHIVVNPTVVQVGEEREADSEGCLSLQGVRVPVERPTTLTIAGKDENGEDVSYELSGYDARIAQHELDHLDGVLIIDRTDEEHRKEALALLRPRVTLR